jgi:photosystem II stability/assembly factor-like uncharacterized protein
VRRRSASLVLAALLVPLPAAANGRFPAASQLVVQKTDPTHLVLRTTFGILFSSDRGQNWDWICEKAVGYSGSEDPSLGVTSNGTVIAGTSVGLAVSPDRGCAWSMVGGDLSKQFVVDVVVRPDRPKTALLITNTYVGQDEAGATSYDTRVFSSPDDGASWAQQGTPLDPALLAETIEVAASNPLRIYVSAVHTAVADEGGLTVQGLLLVSDDGGSSWTSRAVPLLSGEQRPLVAAVDPSNADRVYVRTSGTSASRLLVSDDAGKSFSAKFSGAGALKAFALAADGSKLYIGGNDDGVNVAATTDFVFKKTSSIKADCLAVDGTTLYACASDGIDHFTVGASIDDGASFAPVLHLSTVRGPLACDPASPGGQCAANWPNIQATLGGGPSPASDGGGGADGGEPAAPAPGAPMTAKGGCSAADGEGASVGWATSLLLALVGFRLRSRPSRGSR